MAINTYQRYFNSLGKKCRNIMGVFDRFGVIVASSNSELVGQSLKDTNLKYSAYSLNENDSAYTLFVDNSIPSPEQIVPIISASLNALEMFERENEDKEYLFRQIISGIGDNIAYRAQSLAITDESIRAVYVINISSKNAVMAEQIIKAVAPVRENDCLILNNSDELVYIRQCGTEPSHNKLMSIAEQISTGIINELVEQPVIGIGCISTRLENLNKSYKTAVNALNVGYIFENKYKIYSYMNLGISRLITSVPIEKCKAFLNEVMKNNVMDEIDADTLNTVQRFFDYDLNISLASRELYIHRNTLVYRLNNVQKLTGLDVRKFDDALLFKIAMLIQRYLKTSRR